MVAIQILTIPNSWYLSYSLGKKCRGMPEKTSSIETKLYHKKRFVTEQVFFVVHTDLLAARHSRKEILNWIRCSHYKNTFFFQEI